MSSELQHLILLGTKDDPTAVQLKDIKALEEQQADDQFDQTVYAELAA